MNNLNEFWNSLKNISMQYIDKAGKFTKNILMQCQKGGLYLKDFIYQNRDRLKKNIWPAVCLLMMLFSIMMLLHLTAKQSDLIKIQGQMIKEQQEIIKDVIKTETEMRKIRPRAKPSTLWHDASVFVGKCRAFEIPLKVALISAVAESAFYIYAVGPCGERGTHQAMYWTMRSYFPRADARKIIYWEVASWMHLKECYERSGHELFLTLAYHNAGMNWKKPERAMWVARRHISRCRVIRREVEAVLRTVT